MGRLSLDSRRVAGPDRRRCRRGPGRCGVEPLEPRRLMAISVAAPLSDITAVAGAPTGVVATAGLFAVSGVEVQGSVVRLATQAGYAASYRDLFVELFDAEVPGRSAAPVSTANFLAYVNSGRYDGSFFHRASDFQAETGPARFLQGGGFVVRDPAEAQRVVEVAADPPIALEWAADRPNAAGTIAYARTAEPNSATSGFFFNATANPSFDQPNNRYAAFGRVLGDGPELLNAYAALPRIDGDGAAGAVFNTLPIAENSSPSVYDRLIVVRSAAVVAAPQTAVGLKVSSSAPAIVSARLNADNAIELSYGPQAGAAVVTVTGTDLSGAAVDASFGVTVTPSTLVREIVLGGSGPTSLVATDDDGTLSTFTWRGPGTATFRFTTTAEPRVEGRRVTLPVAAPLAGISLAATTVGTSLSATHRGGDGRVTAGAIEAASVVGRLSLTGVRFAERLSLTGGVANLAVGGVSGPVTVGGVRVATATLGDLAGAAVTLPTVATLGLGEVRDTTIAVASSGTITARAVERSTLAVTGSPRRLAFASLADATVRASGAIGTLAVTGSVVRSRLEAGTQAATVQVGSLVDSTLAVGLAAGLAFPTTAADLAAGSRIGTLVIGSRAADALARSRVTAGAIGVARLGTLSADAAQRVEIFARSATEISGRGPLKAFLLRRVERISDPGSALAAAGLDAQRLSFTVRG